MEPSFTGGLNIAMKIPRADYDATVAFYRDVLGFELVEEDTSATPTVTRSHRLRYGPVTLWLDRVDSYSRSDVWLELRTDDVPAAVRRLTEAGHPPCDEVEPITEPGVGHWIKNPAGVVHLLAPSGE